MKKNFKTVAKQIAIFIVGFLGVCILWNAYIIYKINSTHNKIIEPSGYNKMGNVYYIKKVNAYSDFILILNPKDSTKGILTKTNVPNGIQNVKLSNITYYSDGNISISYEEYVQISNFIYMKLQHKRINLLAK